MMSNMIVKSIGGSSIFTGNGYLYSPFEGGIYLLNPYSVISLVLASTFHFSVTIPFLTTETTS